jgi:hypothetical protein
MARGQLRLLTTEVLRGGKCVGSSHGPPGAVMLGIGLGDRSRDDQRPAREPTRRQKRPFAGLCEALFRTRTETPSLPSRFSGDGSQPMATVLACFRRFRGLFICHRLPLVAPARLHKRSILSAQIRDEKTDLAALEFPDRTRDHLPCREGVELFVPLMSKVRSGETTLAHVSGRGTNNEADGATVSRCARPVGVSKRQQD